MTRPAALLPGTDPAFLDRLDVEKATAPPVLRADLNPDISESAETPDCTDRTGELATAVWHVLRPHQWVKNGLLLAAPFAAEALFNFHNLARLAIGILAFSLAASATYIVNDCVDAARDRLHPAKRHRPIASGAMPQPLALALAVVLGMASFAAATTLGWAFLTVVGIYLALTTAYSTVLKQIPIVDLAAVACGFLLRGVAGAVALHLPVTGPFLLVVSFAALLLVVGKRHGDVMALGSGAAGHRATLAAYTPEFVTQLLAISSTGTLVTYAMWAFSLQAGESGFPVLSLSVVPFAVGALRVVQLVLLGEGADPAHLLADRGLRVAVAATCLLIAVGLLW